MPSTRRSWLLTAGFGLALVACTPGQKARIPLTTESDEARRAYLEGRDALEAFRPELARSRFAAAIEESPGFALAHVGLARAAANEAQFLSEVREAALLVRSVSEGERLIILALEASTRGDLVAELAHYQDLVQLYPDDGRAAVLLGDFYLEQNNPSEALVQYARALNVEPETVVAHERQAQAYARLDQHEEAEAAFLRFIGAKAGEPGPHDRYAQYLLKAGRTDDAIAAYRQALALDAHDATAEVGIGTALLLRDDIDGARAAFRALSDQAQDDGTRRTALVWSAAAELQGGATSEALARLEQAASLPGVDVEARAQLLGLVGDVLLETGSADLALARYADAAQAIEAAPVAPDIKRHARLHQLYREARVALARSDLAMAREKAAEFRRTVGRGRNDDAADLFNELGGRIAMAAGDHREAAGKLERADQSDPRVVYLTAVAYSDMGRAQEALARCRRVLEMSEPRFELAYVRPKARALMETISAH